MPTIPKTVTPRGTTCPRCEHVGKPEDFANGCPACGLHGDSHGGESHADRAALLEPSNLEAAAPLLLESSAIAEARVSLPALSIDADGWLRGAKVVHEPLPANLWRPNAFRFGHAIGFLNHFTDGCGDPRQTLLDRGVSAHGCTLRDLTLAQYVPFTGISFHAFDAAFFDVGWEEADAPGVACEFTVPLLFRQAQLNAVVLDWIAKQAGRTVATRRDPGASFRLGGVKFHTDGLDPRATWDPNRHWDACVKATGDPIAAWVSDAERAALDRSPWSSARFVHEIKVFRGEEEPLDPVLQKQIADDHAFVDALRKNLGSKDDPKKAATPIGAGQRVARSVKKTETATAKTKR